MSEPGKYKAIVLFDGFCNICSGLVLFIIRRDPGMHFMFAASQSTSGKKLLQEYGIAELTRHSIILIRDQKIYQKSGAMLRISRRLRGFWPLFYGFIILPQAFRDFFYDMIARNRYRFYRKRDQCFVPDTGIRSRFLNGT